MIRFFLALIPSLVISTAFAETVVAERTIRANEVIQAADVSIAQGTTQGAARAIEQVIGLEARRVIYAGQPLLINTLGAPALVERNSLVKIGFKTRGLVILTDGRALSRGAFGERIRVMNLESRTAVTGVIGAEGTIWVSE